MTQLLADQEIIVLAEDLYEDLELWFPVFRLREEGAQILLVGTGKETYKGKNGYPVTVDSDIQSINGNDFDAVIIPGGVSRQLLWPIRIASFKNQTIGFYFTSSGQVIFSEI
ncbi:MAG: DJ-1/PfpI family protein [Nitrosomonas sp.]|nr:DJ-1/PfpI family protein [Nitrosomonas sp.]